MFSTLQKTDAAALLDELRMLKLKIATVESCTGGLIAALLTEIAGASDVVERGFITYSNKAKAELVAVPEALLVRCGAVSEEVARAMAEGALAASRADVAVSVTGVAGPGGGTSAKPIGLVHIAAAVRAGRSQQSQCLHVECRFGDIGRSKIRERAVAEALALVRRLIGGQRPHPVGRAGPRGQ